MQTNCLYLQKAILITILSISFFPVAKVNALEIGRDEFPLNETITVSDQDHAVVAVSQNGISFTAWHSYGAHDGDRAAVYARLFDEKGQPLADEFLVNSTTTGDQLTPDVATKNDLFVVTWCGGTSNNGYNVYAKIFSMNGNVLVDEFQVNNVASMKRVYPDVAMYKNGDFVIIWEEVGQNGMNYYVRMFNSQAISLAGPLKVNQMVSDPPTAESFGLPDIAVNDTGKTVAVWERLSGSNVEVAICIFDPYSLMMGNEYLLEPASPGYLQRRPIVDVNKVGDILVTWVELLDGYGNTGDIYAMKYFNTTQKWGNKIIVHDNRLNHQHRSTGKIMDDGRFLIAWTNQSASTGDDIYIRQFDAQENAVTEELLVNSSTTGNQRRPAFDLLETSGKISMIIVWESYIQDGDGWGVFGKMYQQP